ncbi:MAG TPA: glycosyltransferase family 4 protein [Gemmatimonadaceae bacterium]
MRVAIFSEYYAPHRGGVEARVAGIAEGLVELGHPVTVYTVGYDPSLSASALVHGVWVVRYPAPRYGQPRIGTMRRDPLSVVAFALWCRRQTRASFDLLIYEEFPLLHACLAPRRARRHAALDWCEYRTHPLFVMMQKLLPRLFRWNLAVSDAVANQIAVASGRAIITLPSGIALRAFHSQPRSERSGVVYIGRLWPHKNIPLVVECFEELCRRGYGGGLSIVGTGPQEEALRVQIADSPWADRITMTGEIDEAAKVNILSRAEVMLLLSSREGFPVTVAEAMASGLPTVTVDLPANGTVSVIRQYGGGRVAEPVRDAIVDAAQVVLADWDAYSSSCRAAAATLDWQALLSSLMTRDLKMGTVAR